MQSWKARCLPSAACLPLRHPTGADVSRRALQSIFATQEGQRSAYINVTDIR